MFKTLCIQGAPVQSLEWRSPDFLLPLSLALAGAGRHQTASAGSQAGPLDREGSGKQTDMAQ